MDANSLTPTTAGDWKKQLNPEHRPRIVNQIMDRLKRHLPTSVPMGLTELQKIAVHFEEEIYNEATSELDYVRSLSLKLLETKTRQTASINPSMSNSADPNQNASGPASLLMQPQFSNQEQSFLMPPEASVGPGGSNFIDACDWKNQLQPETRQRIVYTIMDTLKRHLPIPVPEDFTWLQKLQKIAVCLEENIFTAATSQSDYFRNISLKLRYMETKTQRSALINPSMSNSTGPNQNSSDPASLLVQPLESNQASVDSADQTGHAGTNDWQEEIYQKIKTMKELYFNELNELYQKVALKLQQADGLIPSVKQTEQYEKMKAYKTVLERMLNILRLHKADTQIALRHKLPVYEKQMINIVSAVMKKRMQPPAQQKIQHSTQQAHSTSLQQ